MKKLLSVLCAFSLVFLSACSSKETVDIYDFSDRFSSLNDEFKIDTKNFTAEETENEIIFPFTFEDKFLLSVKTDNKTSFVKSISVVFMFSKKNKIEDKDFSSFLSISYTAVKALTLKENADNIFKKLKMDNKNNVLKYNHLNFTEGFYDYSFISDEIGLFFSITRNR